MVGGSSPEPIDSAPSFGRGDPNREYFAGPDVSMEETHVCA